MKAIFFDIDDTLYNQLEPFHRAYDMVFGNRFELNIEALFKARSRRSNEIFEDSQAGRITMEEMYIYRGQKAFADLGAVITEEEALEFQYAYAKMQADLQMPDVIRELLDDLKAKGIVLGVITNGPSEHQWKKVNVLNLQQWMPRQHLIISGDIGINKPSREIFDAARACVRTEIEEFWFVGDNYINDIAGAQNAGWKTLWLNRTGEELQAGDIQPTGIACNEAEMCEKIRINILAE